jgi:hypothetical protein
MENGSSRLSPHFDAKESLLTLYAAASTVDKSFGLFYYKTIP